MAPGGYTMLELMRAMRAAGFRRNYGLINGFALCLAENGKRDPLAVYTNTDGSVDRGPWQINNRAHPEVTDAMAFSLTRSCVEAYRISQQGSNYRPWAAWNNGNWERNVEWANTIYDLDEAKNLAASLRLTITTLDSEKAALTAANEGLRATVNSLMTKITNAQEALSE